MAKSRARATLALHVSNRDSQFELKLETQKTQ